jgi:hypothetical protein
MASIDFHPSATFQGAADGFVYQNGPRGLGYYKDTTTQDYLQTDLGAPQTEERHYQHARQPEWPRARSENTRGGPQHERAPPSRTVTMAAPPAPPVEEPASGDEVTDFMQMLLEFAVRRSVDFMSTLREACSPREAARGIMSKQKFTSCLKNVVERPGSGVLIADGMLDKLALKYGCGPIDIRNDGFIDVAWRTFVQDLQAIKGDAANHRRFY